MSKRFIIAGGGTGGHIFPAIAIANAIKEREPSAEILFVGDRRRMEMEKVPKAGYRIIGLDIAGFNRSSLIKNISLPWKLVKSFLQVRDIFRSFQPDAVIGVGGYSSFPVLRYAQLKGIPSFIHEANSFAGRSNIMLGKKAAAVYVAAEGMEKFFPVQRLQITGNPVRKEIVAAAVSREEALKHFSLEDGKPVVLVVGGSLGARSINEAVNAHLNKIISAGIQVIWQTGKDYAASAVDHAVEHRGVWVNAFIDRMELAYAAADIVVSRAGAMAVTELCIAGKPVIFVPFPFAAEDHQTANAMQLKDRDAAWMIKDSEAKEKLVPAIISLAEDKTEQEKLRTNIRKLAIVDADARIADAILEKLKEIGRNKR